MPDELAYFHRVTDGQIVIMGRNNYEANGKALKNRTNIVISRKETFNPGDAIKVSGIDQAIDLAKSYKPEEVFIVGGGEIYKQTLPIVDRIYITIIDFNAEGDVSYPRININDYHIVSEINIKAYEKHPYDHTYYIIEPK